MRTGNVANGRWMVAVGALLFFVAGRADAQPQLLDTWDGSPTAFSLPAGDGCGAQVTVGADEVRLYTVSARLDLSAAGNVRFVIFSHPAHVLLYSWTVGFAADGMTWKDTNASPLIYLDPGETYDIGAIADVAADYQYDTSNSSGTNLDSTAQNPDFTNFTTPTVNSHGASDCAVRIVGLDCRDMCAMGDPIPILCNECTQSICLGPASYCCVNAWTNYCVDLVTTYCGDPQCLPGGVSTCGDGYVTTGEQCEDGLVHPDCCDANCQLEPNLTPCGDDNNVCTDDHCNANGACLHVDLSASCTDFDVCTIDTCDPFTGCQHTAAPDGTACTNDGDPCTVDQCVGGGCLHTQANDGTACADDGNPCTVDECIGGGCQNTPVPNGTPCPSDQNFCTVDECVAGLCTHTVRKVSDCKLSKANGVDFGDDGVVDAGRDKFAWKCAKGDEVGENDLGDPRTDTTYGICVYDDETPSLLSNPLAIEIQPSDSHWVSKGSKGLRYKDKQGTAGGITKILIKAGAAGRTKLKVSGRGPNLVLPGPVGATYFYQAPEVTVQLVNDEGTCWTSRFAIGDTIVNDELRFRAKAKE